MQNTEFLPAKIRGKNIRVDRNGLVSLNDIHVASRKNRYQSPSRWVTYASHNGTIVAVLKKITGKSGNFSKDEIKSALSTKVGRLGGTWAHPNLALAYCEYLSPDLAAEVRHVFLRYKAADPELADDILERASPEANRRVAIRALARSGRKEFPATLKEHGVRGRGYADCTDELYQQLLGGNARELRTRMALPPKTNLRDHFDTDKLSYVWATESLAGERIEEEDSQGNLECRIATGRSAQFIRDAIEADRRDRKKTSPL